MENLYFRLFTINLNRMIMRKSYFLFLTGLTFTAICFYGCSESKPAESTVVTTEALKKPDFGGYDLRLYGENTLLQ